MSCFLFIVAIQAHMKQEISHMPLPDLNIDTFLNQIGFVLIALAFMMRNILYLRLLAIFSSLFMMMYFLSLEGWTGVVWQTIFIATNLLQIAWLISERFQLNLTEEQEQMYKDIFSYIPPLEFKKLMKISHFAQANPGDILIEQGSKVIYLMMIWQGMVDVIVNGKTVAQCEKGKLLGEMSFLSDKPATATVQVVTPTKYVIWLQDDLKHLLQNNPEIQNSMQRVFTQDLLNKLTNTHPENK